MSTRRADIVLRAATPSDADAARALVAASFEKYVALIGKRPAPMLINFEQRLRQDGAFIALGPDGLDGLTLFETQGGTLALDVIAVAPARQGCGVGRALTTFVENVAGDLGLRAVELYTNVAMTDAAAFYRRLGYEIFDRRAEDGFERIYFRKRLSV